MTDVWSLIAAALGSGALSVVVTQALNRTAPGRATEDRERLERDLALLRSARNRVGDGDRFDLVHESILRRAIASEFAQRSAPTPRALMPPLAVLIAVLLFGGGYLVVAGAVGALGPDALGSVIAGSVSVLSGVFFFGFGLVINDAPLEVAEQIARMLETGEVEDDPPGWRGFLMRIAPRRVRRSRDELREFLLE